MGVDSSVKAASSACVLLVLLEGALKIGTSSSLAIEVEAAGFFETSARSFNFAFLLSTLSSLVRLGEGAPLPGKLTPLRKAWRWGIAGASISLGREVGRGATYGTIVKKFISGRREGRLLPDS